MADDTVKAALLRYANSVIAEHEKQNAIDFPLQCMETREAEDALIAAVRAEQHDFVIQHIKSHWFIQGGTAQFDDIDGANADEVVASILEVVRRIVPPI